MRATLALLVTITLLAPLVPHVTQSADAAGVNVAVLEFRGAYGPESWKDEGAPPEGGFTQTPLPFWQVPGAGERMGVYQNPYANTTNRHPDQGPLNHWGYALTMTVELQDSAGNAVESGNYVINAWIDTPSGKVPAKLTKTGVATFTAQFDLDGENGRGDVPALTAGAHDVTVEVYRLQDDPTIGPQRLGTHPIPFEFADAFLAGAGLTLPEDVLPGYTDVAAGDTVAFRPTLLGTGDELPVSVTFTGVDGAITGALAEVVLVNDRTLTMVTNATTDDQGRVAHSTEPSTAMADGSVSALLLLEAHLTGGEDRRLGNSVLAIPVSDRAVSIASIQPQERALGGQRAEPFDTVAVTVDDPNATAENRGRVGDLHVMRGSSILTTAQLRAAPTGNYLTTTFRASDLTADGKPNQYSTFAFVLGENGKFYSYASAARGVGLLVDGDRTAPGERGTLHVTVRSFNDNYDGDADPGLSQTIHVTVSGLPGGEAYEDEITLDERGEGVVEIPYQASSEGTFTAVVNATSGEVEAGRTYELLVANEPNAFDRALEKIPGPGALAGVLALAAVAGLAGRRSRD